MPRVVLDPAAEAHFLQHFEIVFCAHLQPLRFEQFALRFEARRCDDQARLESYASARFSLSAGVTNCFAG